MIDNKWEGTINDTEEILTGVSGLERNGDKIPTQMNRVEIWESLITQGVDTTNAQIAINEYYHFLKENKAEWQEWYYHINQWPIKIKYFQIALDWLNFYKLNLNTGYIRNHFAMELVGPFFQNIQRLESLIENSEYSADEFPQDPNEWKRVQKQLHEIIPSVKNLMSSFDIKFDDIYDLGFEVSEAIFLGFSRAGIAQIIQDSVRGRVLINMLKSSHDTYQNHEHMNLKIA